MAEHDQTHEAHSPQADDHGHDDESHGVGKFIAVFIALCILTAISFAAGSLFSGEAADPNTKAAGWLIMMAVSCAKALLVMLFFMHLLWEANWKYVLTIPATIMSLFLLLMLFPDIKYRTSHYSDQRWLYSAEPAAEQVDHGGSPEDHAGGEHAPAAH